MSAVGEAFIKAIGKPDPSANNGVRFSRPSFHAAWSALQPEVGAGWYLNRFLYLFGEELAALEPCLDAWSFLVPPNPDRMIVGRNAYGMLLVVENASTAGADRVFVLDPTQVVYWTEPDLGWGNLLGYWMANRKIPGFFDTGLYDTWVKENDAYPEVEDILGLKAPLPLGGKLETSNVQLENIIEYYQSTAPVYAKALEQLKSKRGS